MTGRHHAQVSAICSDLAGDALAEGLESAYPCNRATAPRCPAALGKIRRQVTYKAAWHGRQIVVADRFYPKSKTCSGCGEIHRDLKLPDRRWQCSACGAEHPRDLNTATNIKREGLCPLAAVSSTPEERWN